jgi:hypothetical protein
MSLLQEMETYGMADCEYNRQLLEPKLRKSASWVIVNIETNTPVFETFCQEFADMINRKNYKVIPILEYLQSLNGLREQL